MTARILAFAGSARRDSFNKKLLASGVAGARDAGAECTVVDLRDHPLPIYDGDLEAAEGLPENARRLRALFGEHAGLLIASPEYNGSLPALLKNTIDWVSRSEQASPDLAPIRGKWVGLMAASPGPLGGLRVLTHLRTLFSGLGCMVLPAQVTLRRAHQAFDTDGRLTDEGQRGAAEHLGAELAGWIERSP